MKIFQAEFIYHASLMPRPLSLSVSVLVGISGLSSHMAFSDFLQNQEVSVRQGSVGSHHRVYPWPHQGNWGNAGILREERTCWQEEAVLQMCGCLQGCGPEDLGRVGTSRKF